MPLNVTNGTTITDQDLANVTTKMGENLAREMFPPAEQDRIREMMISACRGVGFKVSGPPTQEEKTFRQAIVESLVSSIRNTLTPKDGNLGSSELRIPVPSVGAGRSAHVVTR
jgi:hypothetical protein